jgi:hypothetical protein
MATRAFTANTNQTPYPGSKAATRAGCTCDPDKNHYGRGEPFTNAAGRENRRVYIALYCPMHSEFKAPRDPEQTLT